MLTDLMHLDNTQLPYSKIVSIRNRYSTILKNKEYDTVSIEPTIARKYRGDFFGLLASLSVPPNLWFITLELNRMHASTDFDGATNSILMLNPSTMIDLMNLY